MFLQIYTRKNVLFHEHENFVVTSKIWLKYTEQKIFI